MTNYYGDSVTSKIDIFYRDGGFDGRIFNSLSEAFLYLTPEVCKNAAGGTIYIRSSTNEKWHPYAMFTIDTNGILVKMIFNLNVGSDSK